MDVVVAGNWMNLSLAPEPAKCTGKNDAVMILVKRAAAQFIAAVGGFAESFAGKQCVPVQGLSPYCHYRAGAKLS